MIMGFAILAGFAAPSVVQASDACLSASEARQAILAEKLIEMREASRLATTRARGEVVSVNLCRVDQRLVYVLAVLSSDGRVARVSVDARTSAVSHR